MRDIHMICRACETPDGERMKTELYNLITDHDNRVGYQALWIMTHFNDEEIIRLLPKREMLTDILLTTDHTGKKRLILTLLERMPADKGSIRTDYLDFCLSRINSTEPYGIRALCMKQAFTLCRFYPELTGELAAQLELLGYGELSPGLLTARRNILRRISKLKDTPQKPEGSDR